MYLIHLGVSDINCLIILVLKIWTATQCKLERSIPLENRVLLETQTIIFFNYFHEFQLGHLWFGSQLYTYLDFIAEVLGGCQIFFWLKDAQGILK